MPTRIPALPGVLWLVVSLQLCACGDDDTGASRDASTGVDGWTTDGRARDAGAVDGGADAGVPGDWVCELVSCTPTTGATVNVSPTSDLQAALDAAQPGDTLVLEAGGSYVGNFVLPSVAGAGCITVRTSTPDTTLPPGVRVTPSDAPRLARVITPGNGLPALRTEAGAHHVRLVGLEILPETAGAEVYEVVSLGQAGASQSQLAQVPHHLVIDRCYIHGWPDANFKRGVGLNSADTCILSSTISDIHSDFQDSQAIGGVNGPGPFQILNNRLEGSAENVMFGGGVPGIADLVPSDIEIRGNHFFKPLAWKAGDPQNTGYTPWVKNLFEIKNGRNVVFSGNLLENNWVGADQHGVAIVLTPRAEGGAVPWAVVEHVQILRNIIRHVGGGVALLDRDTGGSSQLTNHITISGNLFEDIRQDHALDIVRVIQLTGIDTVTVDHNTFVYGPGSWPMFRAYGQDTLSFTYTNNVIEYREGVWSDCGTDNDALACILPGALFAGNVIIGGPQASLPAGNFFPATIAEVGFVDYAAGPADHHNYGLTPGSAHAGAGTDGQDPGFDPEAVDTAMGL